MNRLVSSARSHKVSALILFFAALMTTCHPLPIGAQSLPDSTSTPDSTHTVAIWYGGGITVEPEDALGENGMDIDPAAGIGLEYVRHTETGWYFGGGGGMLMRPAENEDAGFYPVAFISIGLNHIGVKVGYSGGGKVYVDLVPFAGVIFR